MAKFRLLDLIKPFQHALPEIENPVSKAHLSFDDKILYSIGIAIFFLFSQLPIYGVKSLNSDPFFSYRTFFSAERGTLAEFGLLPIVSSGFLWQFFAGFKFLNVNFHLKADRGYFQSLQKLTAIVLGGFYAFVLVFLTDYYNPNSRFRGAVDIHAAVDAPASAVTSSFGANFLIWFQLFIYNFILTLLVEILDKDYGFSSGSLFLIAANAASSLVAGMLDFTSIKTAKGYEYKGVLIQLVMLCKNAFGSLFSSNKSNFFHGVVHLFNRSTFVNLKQVLLAVIGFFLIFYLQAFHHAIPIKSKQVKTMAQTYPIKLFFNGALPLVFAAAVFYNVKFANYAVYKFFNFNEFGKSLYEALIASQSDLTKSIIGFFVGNYSTDSFSYVNVATSKTYQVSGLTSYFQPPLSLTSALLHPIQTVAYFVTSSALIIFFSTTWSRLAGSSGKDIAEFFNEQNITILGKRDINLAYYFGKIIKSASATGGLILLAVSTIFDLLGGQGFPTAVVASVLVVFTFLESFFTQLQQSGGSNLYNSAFGQGASATYGR